MIWIIIAFWLGGALVSAMELIAAEIASAVHPEVFGLGPDDTSSPLWLYARLVAPALWPIVVPAGVYIHYRERKRQQQHQHHVCCHPIGSPKACLDHEQLRSEFVAKSVALAEEHVRLHKIASSCPECVNLQKRWLNGDETARAVEADTSSAYN